MLVANLNYYFWVSPIRAIYYNLRTCEISQRIYEKKRERKWRAGGLLPDWVESLQRRKSLKRRKSCQVRVDV